VLVMFVAWLTVGCVVVCTLTAGCCSERDELAALSSRVQQLTSRDADAYQQVKACIELAEQSQMDASQVTAPMPLWAFYLLVA